MLAERSRLAGCAWVTAMYARQRSGARSHHQALRAIANKWLKIFLAMKRNGTCYDERIYGRSRDRYLLNAKAIIDVTHDF